VTVSARSQDLVGGEGGANEFLVGHNKPNNYMFSKVGSSGVKDLVRGAELLGGGRGCWCEGNVPCPRWLGPVTVPLQKYWMK